MPSVELVYAGDCPNVVGARTQLLRAFAKARLGPHWKEWQSDVPGCPEHVRGYGSPTVLVDGRDVVAANHNANAACCRLYDQPDGSIRGVPNVDAIAAALNRGGVHGAHDSGPSWKLNLAMLPGIGAAFLPKLACPACWPAYAGFLSSVGLGVLLDVAYLLPLTAAFLAIAVGALAYRAKQRRGYLPFALGLFAAPVVLAGKFAFESNPAMYAGLATLIGASVWNAWPRGTTPAPCPACASAERQTTP